MANNQICFFYAPTWDYPPGGPIKLGNVISSVKNPHHALHCVPPEGTDVFSTSKRSVQYTKEKLRGGKFSILTKFLSFLGIGADVGAELDNRWENPCSDQHDMFAIDDTSLAETFSFDTIETSQFSPTTPYLQGCLEAEGVRRFLQIARYRKPVYVITGVKVVTGAKAESLKSHSVGANLEVELDGTVWSGVPVSGGPGLEGKAGSKASTKWSATDDFVFAFRVTKVVAGKLPGQVLKEEEYRKGAMLESKQESIEAPKVSVLEYLDLDATSEGFDTEDLLEDEHKVVVVTPAEESW
jgi:hypothetical protein